uniref:Uncharacterized protein n=1 Tax=Oryza sativa subsp. japonica TaxID=39947 RepID=Q5Z600_ORYSJ|nr:hypothetical protein [Oryza sativa Japonica Group]
MDFFGCTRQSSTLQSPNLASSVVHGSTPSAAAAPSPCFASSTSPPPSANPPPSRRRSDSLPHHHCFSFSLVKQKKRKVRAPPGAGEDVLLWRSGRVANLPKKPKYHDEFQDFKKKIRRL